MDAVPPNPEVAAVAQSSFGGDAVGERSRLGFWTALGIEARLATGFAAPSYFGLFVGYERRRFDGTPRYGSAEGEANADCARLGVAYELRPSPDATVTHGFRLVPHFTLRRVVETGSLAASSWSFWFDALYAPSVHVGPSSRVLLELGLGLGAGLGTAPVGGGLRVLASLGFAWGI